MTRTSTPASAEQHRDAMNEPRGVVTAILWASGWLAAIVAVAVTAVAATSEERQPARVAAVAAVGAAERLELLPVDGGDAVPTVPGGHVQDDSVDEGRHVGLLEGQGWVGRGTRRGRVTIVTRPRRRWREAGPAPG